MANQPLAKFAALFEVLGIYAAGQLLAFILASLLGVQLVNPLQTLTVAPTSAELWALAGQILTLLFFQYVGWFILILAVGWWYRRRGLPQYGLTMASRGFGFYLLAGVLLFAFSELPFRVLEAINTLYPLGEQVPWRELLMQADWSQPSFWVLMAVGNFGLIPILEELFYRGYCQTRLEEDFGPATAILATAALFFLSHSQYHILNGYNIGIILTGLFGAVAWGYLFYRTRSLLVTIVAHMLVNIPIRGAFVWLLPVAMLILCVVYWRFIAQYLAEFAALMREATPKWRVALVTSACALFAIAFATVGDVVILLGVLFFLIALVLEWLDKRRGGVRLAATSG